ncbi:hypothetical protein N0V90_012215 [Kalmusia sp. IMI 367209]|nr:hypothetical protein N0V90_012215 [Kalmusia sp. IMI 367209]
MALLVRTARRTLLDSRHTLPSLPFLLPFRAGLTTASHTLEAGNVPDPLIQSGQHISQDLKAKVEAPRSIPDVAPKPASPARKPSTDAREDVVSKHITPSIRKMLPLLHSQPAHYITIHIHGRPYLLTTGDTLRLPFLMPNVKAGDVLRLNRATHIGSRDYTLKAPEAVKGNADHGEASEPMRVMEKTKRRQRHVKHVYSKHKYTVLKISELEVKSLDEYESVLKTE